MNQSRTKWVDTLKQNDTKETRYDRKTLLLMLGVTNQ